jgi:Undecaprenyl-phosphate galactose phosphotransferase WbaP
MSTVLKPRPAVRPVPISPAASQLDAIPQRAVGFAYLLQVGRVTAVLIIFDMLAVFASYSIALASVQSAGQVVNQFSPFLAGVMAAHLACLWAVGLYPAIGWHPAQELKQLVRAATVAAVLLLVALLPVIDLSSPYVNMAMLSLPIVCCMLPLSRALSRRVMRCSGISIPFFFLGSRSEVLSAYRGMTRFGWNVLQPVGRFVHDHDDDEFDSDAGLDECDHDVQLRFERQATYRGTAEDLIPTAIREDIYWLFTVGESPQFNTSDRREALYRVFPQVVPLQSKNLTGGGNQLLSYGLLSGVRVEESLALPAPRLVKRAMDIVISAAVLLAAAPFILLIVALIKISSPGPVFYSQQRIGLRGRPFRCWKFRSMVTNAEEVLKHYLSQRPELRNEWQMTHKLKDDPRITWIGSILRKSSLDELPQLWNVLIGEMSLVGPRPIVDSGEYDEEYIQNHPDVFQLYKMVRPGITGVWQVSGRNQTAYIERIELDRYYVQNWTPWLDIYILVRTIKTVLLCEGAY